MTRNEMPSSLTLGGETGVGVLDIDYRLTLARGQNERPFQRYRNLSRWWIVDGDGQSHLDPPTLNLRFGGRCFTKTKDREAGFAVTGSPRTRPFRFTSF
jgi:hypothetical protein